MTLEENVKEFGLTYFGMDDKRQGIVHIIGPEQGFTLPGTTVVCGDSHTSSMSFLLFSGIHANSQLMAPLEVSICIEGIANSQGLSFGIGTSEVEHVLATQVSRQ